jgi:hypothetical protein
MTEMVHLTKKYANHTKTMRLLSDHTIEWYKLNSELNRP